MITDAIDTAWALGWALLAWIAISAAIGTALLCGTAAAVWWAVSVAWRHRPSWIRSRRQARRARADYEEAA